MDIQDVSSAYLSTELAPRASQRTVSDLLAIRRDLQANTIPYDKRAAHLLSIAAAWAYSDAKMVSLMLARQGLMNHTHYIGVTNDALFVDANAFLIQAEGGRLAILCFRGTEPKNIINWLTDATIHVDPFYSHGHVHGGFYRNVRAIWRNIGDALLRALDGQPIYTPAGAAGSPPGDGGTTNGGTANGRHKLEALYITGHSLGAAMAALAAAIIFNNSKYDRIRNVLQAVYTFGQPMVGDRTFADKCEADFGKIVFRHVYGHDIVPRMPPLATGRFYHFGQEYHSTDEGWDYRGIAVTQAYTAVTSNMIGVLAYLAQQIPLVSSLDVPFSWDDHSPLHYMRCSQIVEPGSEFD